MKAWPIPSALISVFLAGEVSADFFGPIKDAFGTAANQGKDAVGTVANQGKDAVGTAANQAKDAVGTAANQGKDAVGTAANQAKDAVGTAANQGKDAVGTAANRTKNDLGTANERLWEGANHLGGEINKAICEFFSPGSTRKESSNKCSVSGGAGYDSEKGFYTYNPTNPEERHYVTDPSRGPEDQKLAEFQKYVDTITTHETWGDKDSLGVRRLLPANYAPGRPWPGDLGRFHAPTASGTVRPLDSQGGGAFLSRRFDRKSGRFRLHAGTDYLSGEGEKILAPATGYILRPSSPREDAPSLRGVEIGVSEKSPSAARVTISPGYGYKARIFYVQPTQEIAEALKRGEPYRVTAGETVIGTAQGLHCKGCYPASVPNHVHVQLEDPSGRRVSPDGQAVYTPPPPHGNRPPSRR